MYRIHSILIAGAKALGWFFPSLYRRRNSSVLRCLWQKLISFLVPSRVSSAYSVTPPSRAKQHLQFARVSLLLLIHPGGYLRLIILPKHCNKPWEFIMSCFACFKELSNGQQAMSRRLLKRVGLL